MPTHLRICRLMVWLLVFQFTNLPIPVVHRHDSVDAASMPGHIAARHAGGNDCETLGFHIHFIVLGPVGSMITPDSDVPVDPVVPICPSGQPVVAEFDLDSESELLRSYNIEALDSTLAFNGFCDPSVLKYCGTASLGTASALSASWQATFSVMLI